LPQLSRWFIRTGLLYLLLFFTGSLLQVLSARWAPLLWPTLLHVLTVGWLTQLIFGVAFWMFPRHSAASPRGSERLGWACYALLNAGLLLRVIGEPAGQLGARVGLLIVSSALLQLAAGWAFVWNTWPRVKVR
jgi:hypothetical protein